MRSINEVVEGWSTPVKVSFVHFLVVADLAIAFMPQLEKIHFSKLQHLLESTRDWIF